MKKLLIKYDGYDVSDFGIISFHWPISTDYSKNIESIEQNFIQGHNVYFVNLKEDFVQK